MTEKDFIEAYCWMFFSTKKKQKRFILCEFTIIQNMFIK